MTEDVILRLVVIEVIDAHTADEAILDHTKDRLRSALFQLADMSQASAPRLSEDERSDDAAHPLVDPEA